MDEPGLTRAQRGALAGIYRERGAAVHDVENGQFRNSRLARSDSWPKRFAIGFVKRDDP